jgi:hypothetical protein
VAAVHAVDVRVRATVDLVVLLLVYLRVIKPPDGA